MMLEAIKKAKDKIKELKKLRCTCSNMAYQINQGCECDKGKSIKNATKELNNLIESI